MNSEANLVLSAALDLPDDERLEIVEALIASFQPDNHPPFDESWREVISRRSAELKSGQVKSVSWAEVKRQARERIAGG